jgi:phage baseplate assembly protein W
MSANPKLYDKIVLRGSQTAQTIPGTKTYKGFSTISTETESFSLYDLALIKQDLINHFHIRKGERLEQPDFGTIIWDIIFEPLTDEVRRLIVSDVEEIINYDPRIVAENVIVSEYESGLIIECSVTYLPYYITEALRFRFDQDNGLLAD